MTPQDFFDNFGLIVIFKKSHYDKKMLWVFHNF